MYQPRVKGEADVSETSTPQKKAFSKGDLSKEIETRV
jgi:hypothetical protein